MMPRARKTLAISYSLRIWIKSDYLCLQLMVFLRTAEHKGSLFERKDALRVYEQLNEAVGQEAEGLLLEVLPVITFDRLFCVYITAIK